VFHTACERCLFAGRIEAKRENPITGGDYVL
jgi:hypothetical protein